MSFHLRDAAPGQKTEVEFAPDQRDGVMKILRLRNAAIVEEQELQPDRLRILVVKG